MPAQGTLTPQGIIIKKPRDVSRLHAKSLYGTIQPNHQLLLTPIEAAYLLLENKLTIHTTDKQTLTFENYIQQTLKNTNRFDSHFLVYKDLRKRGYTLTTTTSFNGFIHQIKTNEKESKNIHIFTEHDYFSIPYTKKTFKKHNQVAKTWYSIVDEEGDITYYDVTNHTPRGTITTTTTKTATALLCANRVFLFEQDLIQELHKNEFYGKPFGSGLQLSIVEALYLTKNKILKIKNFDQEILQYNTLIEKYTQVFSDLTERMRVFEDLKKRGLIVKTGFKFGAHFRAYTHRPEKTHAEYLIHVVSPTYEQRWSEISRAIRLAHSVNKEILFAFCDSKSVQYIRIGRLRP